MKVPGSQLEFLVDRQLEKVQKVGAQSPTVAEVADAPESSANGIVLRFVTFLHNQNIPIFTINFCNLKKHIQELLQRLKKIRRRIIQEQLKLMRTLCSCLRIYSFGLTL